jgi:hypothetical protein
MRFTRLPNSKFGKIYQYDLDGNFIAEYGSIAECNGVTGASHNTIKRSIKRYRPINSKFIYTNKFYIKLPENYFIEKLHPNSKKVYQYDLNGDFIKEWINATEASKHFKVPVCNIASCCCKNIATKSSCGFQWSYEKFDKIKPYKNDKSKKILQFDLDGKFIKEWNSKLEAMKFYNNQGIRSCVEGRTKQSGGFIWKYKD